MNDPNSKNHYDQLISQALSAEDQQLLARHSEPGYIAQALGMFRGPWTWVMGLVYVVATAAFIGAVYALTRMYAAVDALDAVRYGVLGLFLFQFTVLGKQFMGSHLESNRMMRELKRLELQISLLRSNHR
jgi:hypothetical protein